MPGLRPGRDRSPGSPCAGPPPWPASRRSSTPSWCSSAATSASCEPVSAAGSTGRGGTGRGTVPGAVRGRPPPFAGPRHGYAVRRTLLWAENPLRTLPPALPRPRRGLGRDPVGPSPAPSGPVATPRGCAVASKPAVPSWDGVRSCGRAAFRGHQALPGAPGVAACGFGSRSLPLLGEAVGKRGISLCPRGAGPPCFPSLPLTSEQRVPRELMAPGRDAPVL